MTLTAFTRTTDSDSQGITIPMMVLNSELDFDQGSHCVSVGYIRTAGSCMNHRAHPAV